MTEQAQKGTANERIGQQAVDLAEARNQRNELVEALRKIATADISDGMVRYELKEIARAAVEKAEGS